MASALDPVIADLQKHLTALDPTLAGFETSTAAPLKDTTIAFVTTAATAYLNRQSAVRAALSALQTLARGSYPALPRFTVAREVRDDLAQRSTAAHAALDVVDVEADASHAKPKAKPDKADHDKADQEKSNTAHGKSDEGHAKADAAHAKPDATPAETETKPDAPAAKPKASPAKSKD